jgi:hypothetical protein
MGSCTEGFVVLVDRVGMGLSACEPEDGVR